MDDDSFASNLPGLRECSLDGKDALSFLDGLSCHRRQVMKARIANDINFIDVMSMMSIAVYNAFYKPDSVTIFEPPLFSADYPPVLNYAGGGFVIAHEMGHSIHN